MANLIVDSIVLDASTASDGGTDDKQDEVLFQKLSNLWQGHHRRGLKLRHLTGKKLNARFGSPAERQSYGDATFRRLSEKLDVSESDISRMRWFAHHFKSLGDLSAKHPTATTWTKVRTLIAQLRNPQSEPVVPAPSNIQKLVVARPVVRMIEAVQALKSQAAVVGKLATNGDEWRDLNDAVAVMLKSVGECLGLHFNPTPITERDSHCPAQLMYQNAVTIPIETLNLVAIPLESGTSGAGEELTAGLAHSS